MSSLTRLSTSLIKLSVLHFLIAGIALAASTSSLRGRVTDANGALIAGAEVTVINSSTNSRRRVVSDARGLYLVPELPPGVYSIEVSSRGFQRVIRRQVVLNVAGVYTEDFSLQVGALDEQVVVEGNSSLVNRESATVATVIDRQFVANLPLNGRSFQVLLELTPGVTLARSTIQSTGQFSVNGQRTNANYFMVDGVGANFGASLTAQSYQQGSGTQPALSVLGGFNNLVSVDALQEFRVQTSGYDAQYGRSPGAQVSITTRSGGNEFTGTLFNYFRNEALDAADFFDKINRVPKRKLRQNDFGGVLGGPIRLPRQVFGPLGYDGRDRTFFFASYEQLRLVQPQAGLFRARVPSLAARAAATGPIRAVLQAFPLPNAPRVAADGDPADSERYIAGLSYPSNLTTFGVRFDHRFSDQLTIFGRFNLSPSEQFFRSFPSQENQFRKDTRTYTGGITWTITPRLVSDLRLNYSSDRGAFDFVGVPADGAVLPSDGLLFPSFAPRAVTAVSLQTVPGNFSAGLSAANLTQGKTLGQQQRQFNIVENLTYIAGRHELKFGVDYRHLRPLQDTRSLSISYNFATEASRRTGVPTAISVQAFAPVTDFIVRNASLYAQDAWRLKRGMTMTLGLRYEINPPLDGDRLPYQIDGLENPLTATLARPGTRQWRTRWNNLAPRVGLAWTVSEKADLVLRGGFGIFYDTGMGTALRGFSSFPYNTTLNITNPAQLRFPALEADIQPPPFADTLPPPYNSSFFVFDRNLQLPYTRQWNVTVEKGLGRNNVLTIGYVAAAGRRLLRAEQLQNFNAPFVQQRFGLEARPLVVINPAIFGPNLAATAPSAGSTVSVTRNASNSDYHSFQAQFRRRLARGLQTQISYTWAKSMDDVSDETITGIPTDRLDLRLERGTSDFDIRHNFITALTYDIPTGRFLGGYRLTRALLGNWSVDAIGRLRSALPFNAISQAFDPLNIGTTRRLDLKPGVPIYLDDVAAPGGRRLNPNAFAIPTPGRQGTLQRNTLRGFAVRQLDLSIRRQFNLTEKWRVQFRTEFFNLTNTPNFGDPAASFGFASFGYAQNMLGRGLSGATGATQTSPSPGFNSLYQIGGPRSIQFSLKILY